MRYGLTDTALRIAPFFAKISLILIGYEFQRKFQDSITTTLNEKNLDNIEGLFESLDEEGLKTFHRVQVARHFDFSVIATIIIFASSWYNINNRVWGVTGVIAIICLVTVQRYTSGYLSRRPSNRYLLEDHFSTTIVGKTLRIYYGEIATLIANIIPIIFILLTIIFLNLSN